AHAIACAPRRYLGCAARLLFAWRSLGPSAGRGPGLEGDTVSSTCHRRRARPVARGFHARNGASSGLSPGRRMAEDDPAPALPPAAPAPLCRARLFALGRRYGPDIGA